jgi:phenylalanyl-tRNA synthetase beta chain
MKLSLSWAADYVTLPPEVKPEEIAYALTMATVEVERVSHLAAPLAQVVAASIASVTPHPAGGHLSVVSCGIGGSESIQVVCGSPNLRPGQLVALALPGARLRGQEGQERVVAPQEVRGVASGGVICGAVELGLEPLFPSQGETDAIDLSDLGGDPGRGLAAAIGFDDVILEIDNKSLTNRPDLLGQRGIARELAAIYSRPLTPVPRFVAPPDGGSLAVVIDDPRRCRRYTATRIEGLAATPSPFWLRSRLVRVGQRPINFPVDLTNYVMLDLGQPSHAFDTAQLHGRIHVRQARLGEELELLDGSAVALDPATLVIADERRAVALAGVMGGMGSAISDETTDVVLEAANFEPSGVRRTAAGLGVRTESSLRFEKSLDPLLIDDALGLLAHTLATVQPQAKVVAFVDSFPLPMTAPVIVTTADFINRRLGSAFSQAEVCAMLARLGFEVSAAGDRLAVTVPSWRATGDVSLPEDLVEEVGRLHGYANLPFMAPTIALERPVRQPDLEIDRQIREYLAGPGGMREVVTYPWIENRYLDAIGEAPPLALATPPAPEARRIHASLIPKLLSAVASNLRFYPSFRIFEVARVFAEARREPAHRGGELLPVQPKHVGAALVGDDASELFLAAKGLLEALAREVQMAPLSFLPDEGVVGWADPAAHLALAVDGQHVGRLAAASSRTLRMSGIRRANVALFELDLSLLRPNPSRQNEFEPLPTHPQKDLDLSLLVPEAVRWAALQESLIAGHELIKSVGLAEEYRGEQVPVGMKSLLVKLRLGAPARTINAQDVDVVTSAVVRRVKEDFGAELRAS